MLTTVVYLPAARSIPSTDVVPAVAPLAQESALDKLPLLVPGTTASATVTDTTSAADLIAGDALTAMRNDVASRSTGRSVLPACGDRPVTANGAVAALESTGSLEFSYPVAEGEYRVSSPFGARWGAFHYGTDLAAKLGTPIRAIASGEVVYTGQGRDGRSPYIIIVESQIDGERVQIWYNHMFADGVLVNEGDQVTVGDTIAKVGNNGNSTGPHVHVEVHVGDVEDINGSAVDAWKWLADQGAARVTTSGPICTGTP